MSTQLTVVHEVRKAMATMQPEFRALLPAHVPFDQFARITQTALQISTDLQQCTAKSVMAAVTKCAEAGLLPDGEEGALIAYNVKVRGKNGDQDRWEKQAKFLPMVRGIRNQVQRSGAVTDWKVRVVYEGDTFRHIDGDVESLVHEPAHIEGATPKLVYSIAYLANGAISRHVMRMDTVLRIRNKSRSKESGPWVTDFDEMVKKTCLKQHSKALPKGKEDEAIRLKKALQAIDEAEGLDDDLPQVAPPPAMRQIETARARLEAAIHDSPFEEIEEHPQAAAQPSAAPAAPRRRRTAAEKLAEVEEGRKQREAAAAAKAASVAAPPPQEERRPINWREGDAMPADLADDGRDIAYEQASATDAPDMDEDDSNEDPDAAAFRDGYTRRMSGKSRVPDKNLCQDQGTASAWLQGFDQADAAAKAGTAPKSPPDLEAELDRIVNKVFS